MTNEQNWAVETMDGTEVASGMTRQQAVKRAAELSANTGREYFAVRYLPSPASDD